MRVDDLNEYAQTVVGFPIKEGSCLRLKTSIVGMDASGSQRTSEPNALAVVKEIRMQPNPDQLMIRLDVVIDAATDTYASSIFTESDHDPQFPFERLKTQAEIDDDLKKETASKERAREADPMTVEEEYGQWYGMG